MKKEILNTILLITILIGTVIPIQAQNPGRFEGENKIIISGESNVQDFVVRYYFKKKLEIAGPADTGILSRPEGVIRIPVDKLLFSNRHMREDFLDLVHAGQYPLIKLFYNPRNLNRFRGQGKKTVLITIQITNIKKTFEVPVTVLENNDHFAKLKGQIQIKLSDFKLKPKRYFFGLIRIKDMLNINFILYFYRQVT